MLVGDQHLTETNGMLLLELEPSCVTSVIAGARASDELRVALKNYADERSVDYYEMVIGRSSGVPYFIDRDDRTFVSRDSMIQSNHACDSCLEPLDEDESTCSWCLIEDVHRQDAADRNPYRIYARYGLLDDYIKKMDAIRDSHNH